VEGEEAMTLPMPDFGRNPLGPVHEPVKDEREPKTRHPLMFWDRAKILIFLAVYLVFSVTVKHSAVPIMSWADAFRDQIQSKSWVFIVAAVEAARQLHFLISERSARYHQFWENHVWLAWDRRMGKLNPWLRFRLGRIVRVLTWATIILLLLSAMWHIPFLQAVTEAPGRLWSNPFGNGQMPWFFSIFYLLLISVGQFVAIFWFLSKGGVDTYMPQDIKTRFNDVWGQDKVLDKVKENILLLEKPQEIEGRGGHVPGGMLLWGPPGTGKTLMAEAVAGETGRPYVFVDPGAFINMFFGVGVLKVKGLFRRLRKLALRYGGVIVFFDEADSLGNRGGSPVAGREQPGLGDLRAFAASQSCNGLHFTNSRAAMDTIHEDLARLAQQAAADVPRGNLISRIMMGGLNGGGGGGMGTLQALLTEMSGLSKPRGFVSRRLRAFLCMRPKQPPKYRILVMMATNLPDALDQALLRPGRIDRIYKVDYPTLEGRIKTFNGYFNKVRHDLTDEQVERLATMSPQASGAVIKDIVNESLIIAIREGRDTITWPDVLEAKAFKVHGLADGVAPTDLEQHETAIHEAAHAVAGYLLHRRRVIDIATIEQRGDVGGFVSQVAVEERKFSWRDEMELDVMLLLASLAAERMFFGGDNSQGVGGDLRQSTQIVRRMLSRAGMGLNLTSHVPDPANAGMGTADDVSQARRNEFDAAVESKLQELYLRAQKLLDDNRWFLISIAHALQAHRTITGEDIDAIYHGTRGPTLDGAFYHTELFRRDVIEFLQAAREAHVSQGRLSYPLPRAEEPVLVGAVLSGSSTSSPSPSADSPLNPPARPAGGMGSPPPAPPGPPTGWPTAPPSGPPTW
jgi:ATP-dependent Zn protease